MSIDHTAIERQVAERVVSDVLSKGYNISVVDGEETTLENSKDAAAILAAMFTTDEDFFILRDDEGLRKGFIYFVYGNSGWDVVNDYSVRLESIMAPINEWTDENME